MPFHGGKGDNLRPCYF